jgi:hypothetical protein
MVEMNLRCIVSIYGNVKKNSPVQLICINKNVFLKNRSCSGQIPAATHTAIKLPHFFDKANVELKSWNGVMRFISLLPIINWIWDFRKF